MKMYPGTSKDRDSRKDGLTNLGEVEALRGKVGVAERLSFYRQQPSSLRILGCDQQLFSDDHVAGALMQHTQRAQEL